MKRMMLRKIVFLLVFWIYCLNGIAQKASTFERRWALLHPIAALKVKKVYKRCYLIYNQEIIKSKLDTYSNGGKLDAFRHVFFMAAFVQKVKVKKIKKLGIAHEKNNYKQFLDSELEEKELPDSLGTVMDLKNNELGFSVGAKHKSSLLSELAEVVIKEINAGNAVIMKRNIKGNYLDCNEKVIDLNDYPHCWAIPKCLIQSN